MRTTRMIPLAILAVALSARVALAVQRGDRLDGRRRQIGRRLRDDRQPVREPGYKVTPWPANSADQPYHEHVERYLNEMASQGWGFRTELAAQGARMMVFERLPRR